MICFQPNDTDYIYFDMTLDFLRFYEKNKTFGEATLAIVPSNIKYLGNKESAQAFVDKLQNAIDQMGE